MRSLLNRKNINEWFIAAMLSCNSLSVVFGEVAGLVVWFVVVLGIASVIINIKELGKAKYNVDIILSIFLFILLFTEVLLFSEEITTIYFLKFVCYGLTFMLLPIYNVSFNKIVERVLYIGFLCIPFYLTFDYGFSMSDGNDGYKSEILMTASYNMLPFTIAGILNFRWPGNKVLTIISIICVATYAVLLLSVGSRGALIALLLLLFIQYVSSGKNKKKRMVRLCLSIIVCVVGVSSFATIIDFLSDYLQQKEVNMLAIMRLQSVFDTGGDLTSGRTSIYSEALSQFANSPIWGHGLGGFCDFSGAYPHNMFIQMLVEGGLLFFIPYLYLFIKACKQMCCYPATSEYRRFLVFLFCAGIVRILFSFYLWGSQFFWLMLIIMINHKGLIAKEKIKNIDDNLNQQNMNNIQMTNRSEVM